MPTAAIPPDARWTDLLLLAAPPLRPGAWVETPEFVEQSFRLGPLYRDLAEELGIPFIDADAWEIALTCDGVHFSEEGHRAFADRMKQALPEALALV